jgi:dolichol-phosphate mannosyltransferase
MSKYTLGIVSPTYNEISNIEVLIEQIDAVVSSNKILTKLLIVDDSSPDGTAYVVKEIMKTFKSEYLVIDLYERTGKNGLSTAYIQGFGRIIDECEFVVSLDADLSHQPKYLPQFLTLAKAHELDFVIGSRYIAGGGVENWSWSRKLISRFGSLYAGIILGVGIRDFTGGYNVYRSEFVRSFDLAKNIKATGYLFQIEMKYKMFKAGAKYIESPIIFPDRVFGESKMSGSIIKEAALGVLAMRLKK